MSYHPKASAWDEYNNVEPLPDMTILSAGRRPAAPMPTELFGGVWPLLNGIAQGAGSPVDYVATAFLVSSASLIGGKRRVRPFDTSPWSEPCILWAGVVGDPSAKKSPALDAVTGPLRAIEADHAEEHGNRLLAWQAQVERSKVERAAWQDDVKAAQKDKLATPSLPTDAVEPEEPQRRRTIIGDATPEAVGAILASNPVGTMVCRDELAGLFTSFDRYSPGGREQWLEAFGGRPFVIDRKGSKGPLIIPFNGVSVIGGIQPEKMSTALFGVADDGLVARFLWAWPDPIPFTRPRSIADLSALEDIYRRLDGIGWGTGEDGKDVPVTVSLSPEAADLFEAWGRDNATGVEDCGALYKSFCGKMEGVLLRLALVAEYVGWALNGGREPDSISIDTIAAAAEFVDKYAKPMALRVYGDASLPVVERNAAILARYIIKNQFQRINARDLKRAPHKSQLPTMRMAQPLDEALAYLVDAGWLRESPSRNSDLPGRQRADFIVNPAIFGGIDG